jgi:uncharacterized protein YndB with AHSA1/START domain
MRQRTVTVTRHTAAPIDQVWRLLSDVGTWSSWAPVRSARLERPNGDGVEGVGAIRALSTATGTTRERIVAFEAPQHLGYVLLSGLPLENYRSDVTLQPGADSGTEITWTSTFFSGWFWYRAVEVIVRTFTRRLARASDRASATPDQRPSS